MRTIRNSRRCFTPLLVAGGKINTTKQSDPYVALASRSPFHRWQSNRLSLPFQEKIYNYHSKSPLFQTSPNLQDDLCSDNFVLYQVDKTLFQSILPTIRKENQINSPVHFTILLGVSGGCDSVALLHLLQKTVISKRNNKEEQFSIHVIHFNHQQRGDDSDEDCRFVQDLCQHYKIPFHSYLYYNDHKSENDKENSDNDKEKTFTQESARNWRRSIMRQLLSDIMQEKQSSLTETTTRQIGLLATAHHQDDSDETMLLKFIRGVHITNFAGLLPVVRDGTESTSESNDGVPLLSSPVMYWIRPFIDIRKQTIQEWLHSNNFTWREDVSNQSNKYLRNRVRNQLIPLLQDIMTSSNKNGNIHDQDNPLHRRLKRWEEQSQEIKNDLNIRAKLYLQETNSSAEFFVLPSQQVMEDENESTLIVFKHALYRWVLDHAQNDLQFTSNDLQRVCNQVEDYPERRQWRINVCCGWDIQRNGNVLQIVSEKGIKPDDGISSTRTGNENVNWTWVAQENDLIVSKETLVIKPPELGETKDDEIHFSCSTLDSLTSQYNTKLMFTPPWRKGSKPIKVSEFLRGQKVPLHERTRSPVLTIQRTNLGNEKDLLIVVAVFVNTKNEWIVDATYHLEAKEDSISGLSCQRAIMLKLPEL